MKTKNFSKRLVLNKKTVANLNNHDMKNIYGGRETGATECVTNCQTNCFRCNTKFPLSC